MMTRRMPSLWCLLLLSACVCAGGAARSATPPPADRDGLTRERLPSGLEIWVHPIHKVGGDRADGDGGEAGKPGEVWFSVLIEAGTIEETGEQPGAAFVAKRSAWVEHPGIQTQDLTRFRSGLQPGTGAFEPGGQSHSAAGHGFVEYRLVFDHNDERAWAAAWSHARALLDGWQPTDASVVRAAQSIMDMDKDPGPEQRARRAVAQDMFADHPIGRRPIVPSDRELGRLPASQVRAYIARWYRPAWSKIMIVGDADPDEVLTRARSEFAGLRTGPADPPGPAVEAWRPGRVSAHQIEGYEFGEVGLLSVEPGASADTRDSADWVLDALASTLWRRTLEQAIGADEPDLISAEVFRQTWIRGSELTEIAVRVEPVATESAAGVLGNAIASARRAGWTRGVHESARAELLDRLASDQRAWEQPEPETVLRAMLSSVLTGRAWMPPEDRLELARRVLAQTTDEAVASRAQSIADPARFGVVMLAPRLDQSEARQAASRLLRAAGAAGAKDSPMTEADAIELPLAEAGSVDLIAHDPDSGVWSGTLSNGIVVRARAVEPTQHEPYARPARERADASHEVVVRVAFCDGAVGEDSSTLGRTLEASAAWRYATAGAVDAPALRAWCRVRGLTFRAFEDDHRLVLEIAGPAGSGKDALTLAGAMVGAPGVDARFMDRVDPGMPWSSQGLDALGAMMLHEGDPRARRAPSIQTLDADRCNAWLSRVTRAPIEVAVVGQVDAPGMIERSAQTLGGLPARSTPARPDTWGELSLIDRDRRVKADERLGGDPADFERVTGVVFGDIRDLNAVRPMYVATRLIDQELNERVGTQPGITSAGVWLWLGGGVPGRVTMVTRITGQPERASDADGMIDDVVDAVLSGRVPDGRIQAEIDRAVAMVSRARADHGFWSRRLSSLSWHGLGVEDLADLESGYAGLTPHAVREALGRAVGGGVHKRVLVVPDPS